MIQEGTFEDALEFTREAPRDLLLGNGFSIGAYDGFAYRNLLDRASIPDDIRSIFAIARTTNFEAVMRFLLAEAAGLDREQAGEARRKIIALKRALVRAIHEVHPARRGAISPPRWAKCEDFLAHFIGKKRGGRIFTTNYDLLLCWAVAPDRGRRKPDTRFVAYEGFRGGIYDSCRAATIIYLHGALHLYRSDGAERQLQYQTTGVALHDQIAARLDRGEFPIVVTEGASSLKQPKGKGFLNDALAAFRGTCRGSTKKALFTLGHGLGLEDHHIFQWVPKGTVHKVCLGGHGSEEIAAFRDIAKGWIAERARLGGPTLKVLLFDSTNVVWGPIGYVRFPPHSDAPDVRSATHSRPHDYTA